MVVLVPFQLFCALNVPVSYFGVLTLLVPAFRLNATKSWRSFSFCKKCTGAEIKSSAVHELAHDAASLVFTWQSLTRVPQTDQNEPR